MPGLNKIVEKPSITVKQFFCEFVPAILDQADGLLAGRTGRTAFSCLGPGGGAWTIDLGERRVIDGGDPEADARIHMSVENLQTVLGGGDLDAQDPLLSVRGDPAVMEVLAALIHPSTLTYLESKKPVAKAAMNN